MLPPSDLQNSYRFVPYTKGVPGKYIWISFHPPHNCNSSSPSSKKIEDGIALFVDGASSPGYPPAITAQQLVPITSSEQLLSYVDISIQYHVHSYLAATRKGSLMELDPP